MDEEEEEKVEDDTFYLWDTKEALFSIYKIARNYLTHDYGLDSAVLLELIRAEGICVKQALYDIPFIHSSYIDVILESWKKDNGSQ